MIKKIAGPVVSYLLLAAIYGAVVYAAKMMIPGFHAWGMVFLMLLFIGSTALMMSGKEIALESRVQRFMVATSLQMILALFFVLLVWYLWKKQFAEFVWYFLPFFGGGLVVQAFWMLRMAYAKKQG